MTDENAATSSDVRPQLDWKARATIVLVDLLMRVLKSTWKFKVINRPQCDAERAAGRAVIFCLWHGQMLPLLAEHGRPTTVLISEHRDGEIITRIIQRLGLSAVRGSSSRGGTRALLRMVQELKDGRDVAITPDGPRGPRHKFAPGAIVVSQRSGAAIVMLACHVSRVWRMKSWDQFEIPKPFARITVVYGLPTRVTATSTRDAASEADRFAEILDAAMREAIAAAQPQTLR